MSTNQAGSNEVRPKFLNVKELAELLRIKTRTVYEMVSQGRIPYRKVGDRTIFLLDEIGMDTTQCEALACRHSSNGLRSAERNRPMSVFKRGSKWCFDFWVNGKRYRGSIPEARVKAQAERAENAIRDQVYDGRYGKKHAAAPLLRDFVTNTFLPWSRANKRTWREDVYRSQSILAFFGKYRLDEISSAQI